MKNIGRNQRRVGCAQTVKNNTDQTYSCPRAARLSTIRGARLRTPTETLLAITALSYRGVWGGPQLATHYAERRYSDVIFSRLRDTTYYFSFVSCRQNRWAVSGVAWWLFFLYEGKFFSTQRNLFSIFSIQTKFGFYFIDYEPIIYQYLLICAPNKIPFDVPNP